MGYDKSNFKTHSENKVLKEEQGHFEKLNGVFRKGQGPMNGNKNQ